MHTTLMDTTLEAEAPTEQPLQTLNASHVCDLCGARAYVQASFESGELLFCGHHASKFDTKIRESAIVVVDERSFILQS